MFRRVLVVVSALALLGLAGSGVVFGQTAGPQAVAQLRNVNGQSVGTATFTQTAAGVQIAVQVNGLPPGPHGIHIHEFGQCQPPDFMTAGGHFNPAGRQHGLQNPQGAHAGDMPNLQVGANGSGAFRYNSSLVTLGAGPYSVFRSGGTALVIHAQPDDERTDPAGNSGARIACGVITRAQPSQRAGAVRVAQLPVAQLPRAGDLGDALPVALGGAALLIAAGALIRLAPRSR